MSLAAASPVGSSTGLTRDCWHCLQPPPACTNQGLFLKAAAGWAVLSGHRAGNHREKWICCSSPQGAKLLLVPSRPARGQGHQQGQCWTKAAKRLTRGRFGVFSINLQICPAHFLCHKRRKQPKSMLSSPDHALSYSGVTLSFNTAKDWHPDKSGLPNTFSLPLQKDPQFPEGDLWHTIGLWRIMMY